MKCNHEFELINFSIIGSTGDKVSDTAICGAKLKCKKCSRIELKHYWLNGDLARETEKKYEADNNNQS